MTVTVNSESIDIPEGTLLPELLQKLNLNYNHFAIAINQEVIPRSEFEVTTLQSGDQVELIHAVGGG